MSVFGYRTVTAMSADVLRAAAVSHAETIDDAADYIERLEARVSELESELHLLGTENNALCDDNFTLQQQLEAVKACA